MYSHDYYNVSRIDAKQEARKIGPTASGVSCVLLLGQELLRALSIRIRRIPTPRYNTPNHHIPPLGVF